MIDKSSDYIGPIFAASEALGVKLEDLTLELFQHYLFQVSTTQGRESQALLPASINRSDWEDARELAIELDLVRKQMGEPFRLKNVTPAANGNQRDWKNKKFLSVDSRQKILVISILATLFSIILSVSFLFILTSITKSLLFSKGIIPAIVIPLIVGPIISYINLRQSYLLTMASAEIKTLSRTDALTGLYNKRFFTELVEREIEMRSRYNFHSSLFMIDLDHFKRINDRYGHLAGDHVLQVVSRIILENVRNTDIVCRFGGEELVIYLPHTSSQQALVVAERMREAISESKVEFKDQVIPITASIGIASTESDVSDLNQMLQLADSALYEAKRSGRDQVLIGSTLDIGEDLSSMEAMG
jgi:diguanylate cyclase (GGDEF)-like protein